MKTAHMGDETKLLIVKCMQVGLWETRYTSCSFQIGVALPCSITFNTLINDQNNLPPFVVNAKSVNSFKFLTDNYFLNSRFEFCTVMC